MKRATTELMFLISNLKEMSKILLLIASHQCLQALSFIHEQGIGAKVASKNSLNDILNASVLP
jgi:hypothetical protein